MPSIDQDSALEPSPIDLSSHPKAHTRKSEEEKALCEVNTYSVYFVFQHRSDDVVVCLAAPTTLRHISLSRLMDVALHQSASTTGPKRDNDMVSVAILLHHLATRHVINCFRERPAFSRAVALGHATSVDRPATLHCFVTS